MKKKNKLEQIFFKEGKYVNKKNEEVNPKIIGIPTQVFVHFPANDENILKGLDKCINNSYGTYDYDTAQKYYLESNAFIFGQGIGVSNYPEPVPSNLWIPLTFLKI
mgnify:CR=1 FL=1